MHGLKVDGVEVAGILPGFMVILIQRNDRSHGPS